MDLKSSSTSSVEVYSLLLLYSDFRFCIQPTMLSVALPDTHPKSNTEISRFPDHAQKLKVTISGWLLDNLGTKNGSLIHSPKCSCASTKVFTFSDCTWLWNWLTSFSIFTSFVNMMEDNTSRVCCVSLLNLNFFNFGIVPACVVDAQVSLVHLRPP